MAFVGEQTSDDDDYLVDCKHCPSQVKLSNYDEHLERVHECMHCGNHMRKQSLDAHIKRNHMVKCQHCMKMFVANAIALHQLIHYTKCQRCNESILKSELPTHLANNHALIETIGMIKLDKLSNDEFNRLIDEKRVFAKDGHLFLKWNQNLTIVSKNQLEYIFNALLTYVVFYSIS